MRSNTDQFATITYGEPTSDTILLQMVDQHDLDGMEQEVAHIRTLTGGQSFCLKAVLVNSWNEDLSPWPAPAVFGNTDFGCGAAATLEYLLQDVLSADAAPVTETNTAAETLRGACTHRFVEKPPRVYIGGYSLSGLFALWAGYQTDRFSGIAAASPSIWFPGFTEYMQQHEMRADAVYLSLGDREERTRNPVMAQVGTAIRRGQEILQASGTDCILEWNPGNHFREPELRTARAFAWLMNRGKL